MLFFLSLLAFVFNTFPCGNRAALCSAGDLVSRCFASGSPTATKVAVQHPFWGDVSYPPPGAAGTVLQALSDDSLTASGGLLRSTPERC